MSDDLLRLEEDPTLPESTGWRPKSLADCDFALERVAALERQIQENEEAAAEAHKRIDARTLLLNDKLARGVRWFRAVVEEFARHNRNSLLVGKKKTRELPNGSIAFRKTGGRLVVEDEEALLDWAQRQPDSDSLVRVKTTFEPNIKAIRSYCGGDSPMPMLVPPGCRWEEESETVVVKATGGELLEGGNES